MYKFQTFVKSMGIQMRKVNMEIFNKLYYNIRTYIRTYTFRFYLEMQIGKVICFYTAPHNYLHYVYISICNMISVR